MFLQSVGQVLLVLFLFLIVLPALLVLVVGYWGVYFPYGGIFSSLWSGDDDEIPGNRN